MKIYVTLTSRRRCTDKKRKLNFLIYITHFLIHITRFLTHRERHTSIKIRAKMTWRYPSTHTYFSHGYKRGVRLLN
jgi:hypothetical protein